MRRSARMLVFTLVVGLSIPLWTVSAMAATTCSYDSGSKILAISTTDDAFTFLDRQGSNIRVQTLDSGAVDVTCSGGTPTVNNTDNITIAGSSGANILYIITGGGRFTPGFINEAGSSDEIEIEVDLAGGSGDQMFLGDAPAGHAANVRAGTNGINMFAGEATGKDADLTVANVANIQLGGPFDTPNVISGAGGAGTGGPFPTPLDIRGAEGNDTLTGGAGNDHIDGGAGNDVIAGRAGGDSLRGGTGKDTVRYTGTSGATVDLATGTASDDGSGAADFLQSVENLMGGANRDKLMGNSKVNRLIGGGGNDRLVGRAHNDAISGGTGNDVLLGSAGNDKLNGGRGVRDYCRGGTGTNVLRACER